MAHSAASSAGRRSTGAMLHCATRPSGPIEDRQHRLSGRGAEGAQAAIVAAGEAARKQLGRPRRSPPLAAAAAAAPAAGAARARAGPAPPRPRSRRCRCPRRGGGDAGLGRAVRSRGWRRDDRRRLGLLAPAPRLRARPRAARAAAAAGRRRRLGRRRCRRSAVGGDLRRVRRLRPTSSAPARRARDGRGNGGDGLRAVGAGRAIAIAGP